MLMKVQEGQGQPDWRGGTVIVYHFPSTAHSCPGPPYLGPCLPEGGWGGWSWLAEGLGAAPMTEETGGGLVPHPASGDAEGCVLW